MGRLHIGTSGFVYRDWRGLLYPERLPAARWLPRYAERFSTVELNATFYRLPSIEAVERWRATTPKGFVFAAKGSRYLTHMKRLTDVAQGLGRYFERIAPLREKLAVVLWQLPPQMNRPDPERLDAFLRAAPGQVRHAFEFRDAAWYVDEVCAVLDAHRAAFVEHDLVPLDPPRATGGFRYLRFHGTTGKYQGRYGAERLAPLAESLVRWKRRGDVFAYFNNDRHGHALFDATALQALTSGVPAAALRAEDARSLLRGAAQ